MKTWLILKNGIVSMDIKDLINANKFGLEKEILDNSIHACENNNIKVLNNENKQIKF